MYQGSFPIKSAENRFSFLSLYKEKMASSNVYSPITDISFNIDTPNSKLKKDSIPFWGENPNILLQSMNELFPMDYMTFNQSLNAITRLVILVALFGILITGSFRFIFILFATLAAIWVLWCLKTDKKKKVRFAQDKAVDGLVEGYENPTTVLLSANPPSAADTFLAPSSSNPFGNVLMTDYDYNPNKKPAPPSFNPNTNDDILIQAKKTVVELNPGQPEIADKLFHDLGEQYVFEQSMRNFYSNPATTIPNDQNSFAEFCYGSMVSCKEGNPFACARNLSRHTNI